MKYTGLLLPIVFGLSAFTTLGGNSETRWKGPVEGLQLRIWFYGKKPYEFKRETQLILCIDLRNASDEGICVAGPNRSSAGSSFAFIHIKLKGPDGKVHQCLPWLNPLWKWDGVPFYKVLKPGEITHWEIILQSSTKAQHWDWWKTVGFPPGKYEITIIYDYPGRHPLERLSPERMKVLENESKAANVWHGKIVSNSQQFFILNESCYGEDPPPDETPQVVTRNEMGLPQLIVFLKDGKVARERFYQMDKMMDQPIYLTFEMVYDQPGRQGQWKREGLEIPKDAGRTSLGWWRLTDSKGTGDFTLWSHVWHMGGARTLAKARYKQGLLDGDFYYFDESRGVYHGKYVAGKKEGSWTKTVQDSIQFVEHYRNGLLHGERKRFSPDGRLRGKQTYEEGYLTGEVKGWHKNGQLYSCVHYKRGKLNGTYEKFAESGQKLIHQEFQMGIPSGTWMWFDVAGNLLAKGTWRDGERYDGTFLRSISPRSGTRTYLLTYEKGRLKEQKQVR